MRKLVTFLIAIFTLLLPQTMQSQIDVKEKVKNATQNRAEQRTNEGVEKTLDKVEEGIKSLFKKKKKTTEQTGADTESTQNTEANKGQQGNGKSSLQSYSKFDFIPGEKVSFFDDFSQDAVGDFPALWYSNGSGEVVTLNNYPGNWLIIKAPGFYYPEKSMTTTDNFTIEFDLIPVTNMEDDRFNFQFNIVSGNIKNRDRDTDYPGDAGLRTSFGNAGIFFESFAKKALAGNGRKDIELDPHEKIHLSYWIQKTRVRIYINEKKVVDAPRIMPEGFKYNTLMFYMTNAYNASCAITNLRLASGLPDMRNKLMTEGKLVTYGIYFDVNKDIVKPESYGTLKEIATILNEVPNVEVKIVGHTDADGNDATNLDLSKRRAASVKAELVKSFGVNAERLVTDGAGETKPVVPNDTPANKALNRRVEFIKM